MSVERMIVPCSTWNVQRGNGERWWQSLSFLLGLGMLVGTAGAEEITMLRIVAPEAPSIPRYGKFEVRLETDASYQNPFDPREVDLQVEFEAPSGQRHTMPAFYDEEDGQPVWKARYAPMEVGTYRYRARLGETFTSWHTFESVPSDSDGFVRIAPEDSRYFQFDSGKPYFAIGHNVCWTEDYESYFRKMAAHGENYTRIWMIHWNVALEWSGGDYPGLGRYHLGHAARLDHIFDLAEKYGIYLMLCLESFNTLRIRQPYPAYRGNPYAKENGGMLERPEQFFTHPEARRLFKQRLRYLVARYAYRTHLLAWEFWNEVDIIEKYISQDVVAWHQEMAHYLRSIDPMRHLITTSFANTAGDPAIWRLPEIEFTQNHQYGSRDMAESIRYWTQRNLREFGKPHLFGEYGTDAGGPHPEQDPTGINLHNGLWAAPLSGSAGTAMLWWWDNYIEPKDLYSHFLPFARFAEDIDWPRAGFRDAQIGEIRFLHAPPSDVGDLELPATTGWGHHPVKLYRILRDGTVEGNVQIAQFLYPQGNPMREPQNFAVDYPQDGAFEVVVHKVSREGRLQISLDGELVLDEVLPTGPGEGPWKQCEYRKEWDLYQCIYDKTYRIEVPAGKHTITVDNAGKDWISVSAYRLRNYRTTQKPELRVFGLQSETQAILWLQNRQNTWYRQYLGMALHPIAPAVVEVRGLRDGLYDVAWWDTYEAGKVERATARCEGGMLLLKTPTIERDIACKLRWRSEK